MIWLRIIYLAVLLGLALNQALNSQAVRSQKNEISQVRSRILNIESVNRNRRVRDAGDITLAPVQLTQILKRIEQLEKAAGLSPQESDQ